MSQEQLKVVIETTLDCANALKEMGLFAGTDKGYELEALPTRTHAIVFLLRMLGEEKPLKTATILVRLQMFKVGPTNMQLMHTTKDAQTEQGKQRLEQMT